jgi:hypothetical protein
MIRRPLTSIGLKQSDIDQMEASMQASENTRPNGNTFPEQKDGN